MLDLLLDGLFQVGGWLSDSPRRRWHQQVKQAGLWPAYDDSMGFFAVDHQGRVWFSSDAADWSNAEPVQELQRIHFSPAAGTITLVR